MNSKLIIMLTLDDKTVADAISVFEEAKNLPVECWGFKDVGLETEKMRTLIDNMKEAGKTTFLEIVSYTEDECMAGAKLAVEFGFDYLMGTIFYDSVYEYIKENNIEYLPFCGKVSQSPSILEGTNREIIDDAKELLLKGVDGFDILAYRHVIDGEKLAMEFCSEIDAKTVIAGSINSFERIDIMAKINPWGFTIGSALFAKQFDESGTFLQNLELVVKYMDTID